MLGHCICTAAPLAKAFPCWPRSLADFLFERRLNDYIFQIVSEFSSGKPSLVFCSSRRGTSETAAALAKAAAQAAGGGRPSVFVRDPAHHARLVAAAAKLGDSHLRECVQLGVGYHHAAMEPEERAAVEALFSAQDLPVRGRRHAAKVARIAELFVGQQFICSYILLAVQVLCTTSTLAMGVNLPARLVVVKVRPLVGMHVAVGFALVSSWLVWPPLPASVAYRLANPPSSTGHTTLHWQRSRGPERLPGVRTLHLPAGVGCVCLKRREALLVNRIVLWHAAAPVQYCGMPRSTSNLPHNRPDGGTCWAAPV